MSIQLVHDAEVLALANEPTNAGPLSQDYYGRERREIAPFLPSSAERVLEIGCGAGGTLRWLKQTGLARQTLGIEYVPEAARKAAEVADMVRCGDIEATGIPYDGEFDVILCLDVLEHLRDPWGVVRQIRQRLKPGGTLIVSVPNARHHSVTLPLLLKGEFRYQDAGILDRTHLRFFTRESARELLEQGGFNITAFKTQGANWHPSRVVRALGRLSPFEDLCAVQFLLRAQL